MHKKPILKGLVLVATMGTVLVFCILPCFAENITITTYYPAPFGVYMELRAERMAIGENYYDPSQHCWPGGSCPFPDIEADADLVVEGNVGIGTSDPQAKLHILRDPSSARNGNITFLPDGSDPFKGEMIFDGGTDGVFSFTNDGVSTGTTLFSWWNETNSEYEPILAISNSGNVGIGTSNPQAKLHVGGISGTDGIMFPDGTLQTTAGGAGGGGTIAYTDCRWVDIYHKECNGTPGCTFDGNRLILTLPAPWVVTGANCNSPNYIDAIYVCKMVIN